MTIFHVYFGRGRRFSQNFAVLHRQGSARSRVIGVTFPDG